MSTMNTKEFVQVLRKIIKEEVKSAVQEAIRDASTNSLLENISTTSKAEYNYKPKKVVQKQYTKDPLLNSLLNETALTSSPVLNNTYSDMEEWPTMNMNSYASLMGSPKFVDNKQINAIPDGINPNAVPTEVKSALTRDYRSLMKAIDKKKGK